VSLSPADDVLIRVERPLDFDSEGQLVASVLSKKAAAGSTHVVIDMPVGPTAKVRSAQAAASLTARLRAAGAALGLGLRIEQTDGSQPVGRGIGPALEARDVLAVLQAGGPPDLRSRAIRLAGAVLELSEAAAQGEGEAMAGTALDDGRAWRKLQAICEAQGGMREPPKSSLSHVVEAQAKATIAGFDNRRLARIAKLAGAPSDKAAGLDLHVRVGERVERGQPLFTIHAQAAGELAYALDYLGRQTGIVMLEPAA
jgi:thymidine phosphorylase